MVRSRLEPPALAWVDPAAQLIIIQDGLPPEVECRVLRQACAGLLGDWNNAPDAALADRSRALRPDLRLIQGGGDNLEVG